MHKDLNERKITVSPSMNDGVMIRWREEKACYSCRIHEARKQTQQRISACKNMTGKFVKGTLHNNGGVCVCACVK